MADNERGISVVVVGKRGEFGGKVVNGGNDLMDERLALL